MAKGFKLPLLENVAILIVLGLLAGAIGGFAIGLIQKKSSTPSAVAR